MGEGTNLLPYTPYYHSYFLIYSNLPTGVLKPAERTASGGVSKWLLENSEMVATNKIYPVSENVRLVLIEIHVICSKFTCSQGSRKHLKLRGGHDTSRALLP